jgi:hypothetical protein
MEMQFFRIVVFKTQIYTILKNLVELFNLLMYINSDDVSVVPKEK